MTALSCGCSAQAVHHNDHDGLGADHPACVVHDCCGVVVAPDLAGRMARCTYFSKPSRKSECNKPECGGRCSCERLSSGDLAFFQFHGAGSQRALTHCVCGYHTIVHEPLWAADLDVDMTWYALPRKISREVRTFHAPESMKALSAEREADFRRAQKDSKTAPIHGVAVVAVRRLPPPIKCRKFTPIGPAKHDEFYCGCHGWD